MSFKNYLISVFIIIGSLCFTTVLAWASRELDFNSFKTVETVIGAGELNRIQVKGGEVLEVVGNENKYSLYWSSDWRNLFIVPKVEVGETINMSLILGSGLAQDIRFTVGDVVGQTIFINNSYLNQTLGQELEHEIRAMFEAMREDIKGKYYVIPVRRSLWIDGLARNVVIRQLKAYLYKGLTGSVLEVHNRSRGLIKLKDQDFNNMFVEVVAVSIENPKLYRWDKSRVFVITRNTR
jgi:hypothetical protein